MIVVSNTVVSKEIPIQLSSIDEIEPSKYQIPVLQKGSASYIEEEIAINLENGEAVALDFVVEKKTKKEFESRGCISAAGFVIGDYKFILQNNKKDLFISVGTGNVDELPYYIINRHTENNSVQLIVKQSENELEWYVKGIYKNIGGKIKRETNSKQTLKIAYSPSVGNDLSYFISNPSVGEIDIPSYDIPELHPLYKYESTAVSKYDWTEPAAKHLVLEGIDGKLTKNELNGLVNYLLEYKLPTHNHMNYYFRKRMNSYMMEWTFEKTKEIELLNKAIQVAQRAIKYRNDNFGKYKISYSRTAAPLWPNYKEIEVYEDGSVGLVPGASTFAGLPTITVPVRMIADNPELWKKEFEGQSYYEIAMNFIDEALKTIDYTYETFVGEDHLIRYPDILLRTEWHGKVYIYNRGFPVLTGAIPLVEALEIFNLKKEKVKEIDLVNQSMINYLQKDMTFYMANEKECLKYPYSQALKEKSPNMDQVEDFTHGSFDSRDFQLFYKSGRYNFDERYVHAMANTLVEKVAIGDGTFSGRMDGKAKPKKYSTPISYDGFIWYASYRPEIKDLIARHIIDNKIAYKNGVYDVYCLYEILKLKDKN